MMLNIMTVEALEFTEANVRNAIANVNNLRGLGEQLQIPPSKLDDIGRLPQDIQKQKFVEVWFKVDTDCNWDKLAEAMRVHEWKTSKSISAGSECMSPCKSNGSRTNSFGEAIIPGNITLIIIILMTRSCFF
jgi:hypothetical protein